MSNDDLNETRPAGEAQMACGEDGPNTTGEADNLPPALDGYEAVRRKPPPMTPTRHDLVRVWPLAGRRALVQWSVSAEGIDRAHRTASDAARRASAALRVFQLSSSRRSGDNPVTVVDVPLDRWIGELEVQLDRPGALIVAAVGCSGEHAFVHIARSPGIHLPPERSGDAPVVFEGSDTETVDESSPTDLRPWFALDGPQVPIFDFAALARRRDAGPDADGGPV